MPAAEHATAQGPPGFRRPAKAAAIHLRTDLGWCFFVRRGTTTTAKLVSPQKKNLEHLELLSFFVM